MVNPSAQTTQRSPVPLLIALGLAAIGWEVWLDTYYLNSAFLKILWGVLAVCPVLLTRRGHLFEAGVTTRSGCLQALACGIWLLCLGMPYGTPAMAAMGGIVLMLSSSQERVRRTAGALYALGLLMCLQAILAPVIIRLMGITGTIERLSPTLSEVCRWFGIDSIVNGGQLTARNAHLTWQFGPTPGAYGTLWISLFVGSGLVVIYSAYGMRKACLFGLLGLVLLPVVRYVTLISLYLQFETVDWFFNPTVNAAFLLVFVFGVTAALKHLPPRIRFLDFSLGHLPGLRVRALAVPALLTVAGLSFVFGILCPDPGRYKAGRVLIDESHGGWEWSTEEFGKDWYGQAATYNYWCILDYVSAHYPTQRNRAPLSPEVLKTADVLIVKTPTMPFSESEVEAIVRWVDQGGGLFLIGDHTDVFGTTTCLQPLSNRFGLQFCYDSTHDLQTGNLQVLDISSTLRHPVVANMPPHLLWGTSCSLTANLRAEPILIGNHLRGRYLDYGQQSFFAQDGIRPNERFGAILQCAGVRHGKGRVVAFTDSTIFSNFWTFFPGKAELFMGAVGWLNRWNMVRLTVTLGCVGGLLAYSLARILMGPRKLTLGCYVAALLIAIPAAVRARDLCTTQWYALPPAQSHMNVLLFDREYSSADMPDFAMQGKSTSSYQTFYTWVQRLGVIPKCMYSLKDATKAPAGSILMIRPQSELSPHDLRRLERFFQSGGRLLVLDGMNNPRSMVNLLLQRHGLSIDFHPTQGGALSATDMRDLPNMSISPAYRVEGGNPVLQAGGVPILSRIQVDRGEIWACSLADQWSDAALGVSNAVANNQQRLLSELEYWAIGQFMGLTPEPTDSVPLERVARRDVSTLQAPP